MLDFMKDVNRYVWGAPTLFLLLGTHVFFTIRSRFVQRHIGKAIRLSLSPGKDSSQGVSGFAALTTTLAATLGIGNIIGVSTAIALGGPGALLWCWLTGILGMATTYGECYLSVSFQKKEGGHHGGPMYVLESGLHNKGMALAYAVCLLLTCVGVGCLTQINAIVNTTSGTWDVPPMAAGIGVAIIVGMVVIGGIHSISKVCMRLMPALGAFFLAACLLLIIKNSHYVPAAVSLILKNAFSPTAMGAGVAGGGLRMAARYGVARGLFTNEAGLGTAAVFAASSSENPQKQALISMTATFWDTVVLCAITGIAIVAHLLRQPVVPEAYRVGGLTSFAFSALPGGETLLTIALVGFALSTILGWAYLGEQAFSYLFGASFLPTYHLIYILMIFVGTVLSLELVWELTDFFNAFLILPNLYALYRLNRSLPRSP